jgi:hypothetical protein
MCANLVGVRTVTLIAAAWILSSSFAYAQQCVGDCDGNGAVGVNELIRCVGIALGLADVSTCPECDPNDDNVVRIPELITAVSHALCDCEACPARVPTNTPTPTTQTSPTATQAPAIAMDGGVLFGERCVDCHETNGSDIADPSAAGIRAAIDDPSTGMEAFRGLFSASQIEAMSSYLTTLMHSDNWRDQNNHGSFADFVGVASCRECHGGPPLMGEGDALSCFTCHGRKW